MKEMKWNGSRVMMVMLVTVILLTGSLLMAQEDKIILDSSKVLEKKGRPVVTFPHSQHIEAVSDCKVCHHIYQNGKNVLDESQLVPGNPEIRCLKCHGERLHLPLQQAFHDQCIGCHVRHKHEKKRTGPRYCGACHIRK